MARASKRMESEQDRLVAASLYAGDSPSVACERAGYAKSTIRKQAGKICRSERVQSRLREIARNIHANELTTLGRARIHEILTSDGKNDKTMLAYIRTGVELEGALGNHAELHLHAHQHAISPEEHREIADAIREAWEEEGWTDPAIDVEAKEALPWKSETEK